MATSITTIFLDIGGIILTNGWDRHMRRRAAELFGLDYEEMDERHHLIFNIFEEGKLTLDDYLDRVVFYQPRPFTREDFKAHMFAQSQPFPEMIDLIRDLQARYQLRIAAISNEGRELSTYRIKKFELDRFIDYFVISCFIHMRKPDPEMYRFTLNIAQEPPEHAVYIDDRAMFVEAAEDLRIHGIHHTGYASTERALAALGLTRKK